MVAIVASTLPTVRVLPDTCFATEEEVCSTVDRELVVYVSSQGRFHHLGRQLLLFADVVDQVAETGKQDESHRVGLGEKNGADAGV